MVYKKSEDGVKTRYGRTIRKPDKLMYQETTSMLSQPTCRVLYKCRMKKEFVS